MQTRFASFSHRFRMIVGCGCGLILLLGAAPNVAAQTGAAISANTKSGFKKSNQSKVFYYDSQWWALAFHAANNRWEIWRYNGVNWLTTNVAVQNNVTYYCDAMLNPNTGKLYVFSAHKSAPRFHRFSYLGGTWQRDAAYPLTVAGFGNFDLNHPTSLVQAKNGDLWIFRVANNILQAKRSTDDGLTWSDTIHVKTGLTAAKGTTDAAVFSFEGDDYVGVAYGEPDSPGSKFGFLYHSDDDSARVWIDESIALTFFNNERANSRLNMTNDASDNIYLLTQNGNATGSKPSNNLYKRTTAGVWETYRVNTASTRAWKTPALAIDATNNRLYVMGVNTTTLEGEYKSCLLGEESQLDTAAVSTLLSAAGGNFDDLSAPALNVDAIRGLMVCGDNLAAGDIWFRHLSTGITAPLIVGAVTVDSNEVNANASYTIPLTLSDHGGLAANSGTIHFRFPGTTFVPNGMTASEVLVNGTPCTAVISNSTTRQVSLTTPENLSDQQNFSVVFNSGAGLLNPTAVSSGNNYRVTVWTSRQPTQVVSPKYSIAAATTTVTPANVVLANNLAAACSTYTITFNLGAHGRLLSGSSTFTLAFDAATTIAAGALSGVTVNGVAAAATGDNTAKTVTITLPAAVSFSNNAAVNLLLPPPVVCNPPSLGDFTLAVNTSIEAAPAASNIYRISTELGVGDVLAAPTQASAPASYTIPLVLSSNGNLTAGVDAIAFRFPAGTIVPSGIAANQILVDDTPAASITANATTREVYVTTPVNLANDANVCVLFKTGAGLFNPDSAGNYSLEAWTSMQSLPSPSPLYAISADAGSAIATTTKSGYKKSNQSKVFYYDNQWWAIAFYTQNNRWYLWKYDGTAWIRSTNLDKGFNYYWDAVLNAGTGKLYLIGSNITASDFRRYTYTGGAWSRDAGFPITLADFTSDVSNPISMAQAKNGVLWIFRVSSNTLQAKYSSNGGVSWSDTIHIKTGLTTATATTDAAAFTSVGKNYIGVAYAEPDNPAPISRFGFLKHRDSDADTVWSDESAALTFFGNERAHNALCMTTDGSNVYLFTRAIGVDSLDTRNILYKRGGGAWFKYKVNSTSARYWKTPAIAIDADNSVIYTMGVNLNTSLPEYKICLIGDENNLENAAANELFSGASSTFDDLSLPAANVGGASGLMVTIDNATADDIWYRHLAISGNTPVGVGSVSVFSNEVNANATYTIPLTLSKSGGLEAGTGVINFIFPANTLAPNNMLASAVIVAATPATAIISNSTTRQVSITTPVDLSGSDSFTVVFNPAAGLLNPSAVGDYQITAWTSSQPAQVNSPSYSLAQATTTVTPATVALLPSDPDSLADYTLNFNLGGRGRLLSGVSEFLVKFGGATQITNGALSGAKVNTVDASATGDSVSHQVTVAVPSSISLSNNAAITLYLPKIAIRNPSLPGDYTLTVATSVETTAVASNPYTIQPFPGIGRPITGTTEKFDRNNQSKMFYHAGFWWVTAQSQIDQQWYLWKFDGAAWSQNILVHATGKNRPDCILEASNNRVYVLLPGSSTTYITRLKYNSGAWSIDSGYPYAIPDFAQSSDRGVNLVRASNSDLWVFMMADSILYAKKSSDAGKNWSATKLAIKRHLHSRYGLTDGVAFSFSGSNHIGVGYAEDSTPGSIYGFLRHKNSDDDTVWTDETASIPQFANTTSDDHLSMAVYNNVVFMIVKTNGGGPSTTSIGLLHRETNADWLQDPILLSSGWTRPAVAVDAANDMLYAIGTREASVKVGEMKKVAIGSYGDFVSAPVDTIFKNGADNFADVSVAAHAVTSAMNLLVCAGNDTRGEVWYNLIALGAAKHSAESPAAFVVEEKFEGVQVYPNPSNPQTSFRFRVKETGPVKLRIFNLNGQLVRTLIDEEMQPGVHQKRWNGRNQNGRQVASGFYFYRMQIGAKIFNGRIQMIK